MFLQFLCLCQGPKKRLVYGWLVWRSETFWLLISRHDHGPLKAWILPILSIATLIFGTQNFKLWTSRNFNCGWVSFSPFPVINSHRSPADPVPGLWLRTSLHPGCRGADPAARLGGPTATTMVYWWKNQGNPWKPSFADKMVGFTWKLDMDITQVISHVW